MARIDKDINIPLGPQSQAEDIREALIKKIQQQEEASQSQASVQPEIPSFISQPTQTSKNQERPFNHKTYDGFGTYSSPFINQPSPRSSTSRADKNLIDAIHANEPIKYKPKKRKSAGKAFLVLFLMIAIIFALSWALREFVFQAYEIPSGSMENTIMTGDMVFAEKISPRFSSPKQGEIVTFNDPLNEGRILIKRVVATGGQTVDIKDNKLYVDGIEQREPYVNGLPTNKATRQKISYPYTVPDDCVWVMGDNRTNSQDSRYFGAVPTSDIIGHGLFIYWPFDHFKALG